MTIAIEKYVRELIAIKCQLSNLQDACQSDLELSDLEREDIAFNIARLSKCTAYSIAELIDKATQSICGTRPS